MVKELRDEAVWPTKRGDADLIHIRLRRSAAPSRQAEAPSTAKPEAVWLEAFPIRYVSRDALEDQPHVDAQRDLGAHLTVWPCVITANLNVERASGLTAHGHDSIPRSDPQSAKATHLFFSRQGPLLKRIRCDSRTTPSTDSEYQSRQHGHSRGQLKCSVRCPPESCPVAGRNNSSSSVAPMPTELITRWLAKHFKFANAMRCKSDSQSSPPMPTDSRPVAGNTIYFASLFH